MLRLIHTNDLHGKLSAAKLPFLLGLRDEADLYFDTGDAIATGNLGIPLRRDDVWEHFSTARLDAFAPGNRESHILSSAVSRKLAGCPCPVLSSNWQDREGLLVFLPSLILDVNGMRVGLVAGMVAMVTPRMKTQAASRYLWTAPIPAIAAEAQRIRPEVDCLIALTHIGLTQDRKLAETCPDLDLILGGHSHDVLTSPLVENGVPILQGGSHARFIGAYAWSKEQGLVEARLVPWA